MDEVIEIKVGDEIVIENETHKKWVRDTMDRIHGLECGLAELSNQIYRSERELWGFIKEVYPELKDCNLSVNAKEGRLLVINKAEDTVDSILKAALDARKK